MTLQYFFSKAYLFDSVPPVHSRLTLFLLVFFSVLVLVAIYLMIMPKDLKKIYGRFKLPALVCGVLGLLYLFARYESLAWLASRFFLCLIAITLIIWVGVGLYWLLFHAPKHITEEKIEQIYKKYLPKKKR